MERRRSRQSRKAHRKGPQQRRRIMNPFIPALLAKLTLILALGLIIAATLRASSPSLRHLVLFATLPSCLVLPAAMLLSPQWNVHLLPSSLAKNAWVTREIPATATTANSQSL